MRVLDAIADSLRSAKVIENDLIDFYWSVCSITKNGTFIGLFKDYDPTANGESGGPYRLRSGDPRTDNASL